MKRYSPERKEWAILQMMPPHNRAVVELARSTGITTVTLRTWQREARSGGRVVPGNKKGSRWSSVDKFRVVLQTQALSEAELSEYCRANGVLREQIEQWRVACEQANDAMPTSAAAGEPAAAEAKLAQARIRELERQLRRKDAALAEAAALLVLGKKAEAIWGKDEES